MRPLQVVLRVVLAVTAVGCATTHPTSRTQYVQITSNRDAVKRCAMFGPIEASEDVSAGATVAQMPNERVAYRRLRAEAARLGANTVLLTDIPKMSSSSGETDSQLRGEAYACDQPGGSVPAKSARPGTAPVRVANRDSLAR